MLEKKPWRRLWKTYCANQEYESIWSTSLAGEYRSRHQYVAGIDWGRTDHYTVTCVLDTTIKTLAHLNRFQDVPSDLQLNPVRWKLWVLFRQGD
jgi:hypothetical protein